MILNNAPQAEAVLSNVGEIGEFRIRNSAKAFNILSSGLYANKIKAIIRELSCNALDSHIAAGTDKEFEVHLPTTLEPYFSIRDFGTGLNHDQVTNIYTTYFESTKTNSNAFIGALGLGSKSPFSYTDNFTVTAVKDGHKGIYSAFINGEGVPSIALMGEEQTDEPAGVEIKFSVNDRNDFYKFESEASKVFRWFKQQPKFTGSVPRIEKPEYGSKDIIPGVHQVANSSKSIAIMGNIAYPIEVPNHEQNLGILSKMLNCGLVMEFGIGELDFQASREGLSYIPQTIQSIKNKLQQLNVALSGVLAKEANEITNDWHRSMFLNDKKTNSLWTAAVSDYVTKNNIPLYDNTPYSREFTIEVKCSELEQFNVSLSGFVNRRGERVSHAIKTKSKSFGLRRADGSVQYEEYMAISVASNVLFVANDTKIGSVERAKAHFRNHEDPKVWNRSVFVLNKIDKTKDMDLTGFYNRIFNPPMEQLYVVSKLDERERKSGGGMAKNISILTLEERGGSRWHSSSQDLVWRDAGKLDQFVDTDTYYYIPMKGFEPQYTKVKYSHSVPHLVSMMKNSKMPALNVKVYGVRKGDLPTILAKKNWVNVESYIEGVLIGIKDKVVMADVMATLDRHSIFEYNYDLLRNAITNDKSPAKLFLNDISGLPALEGHRPLKGLLDSFGIESAKDINALSVKYKQVLSDFSVRYSLIEKFGSYAKEKHIAEYIDLVDSVKGV